MQHLIQKGYDPLFKRKGNVSLLHIAVSNGNLAMVQYLIEKGLHKGEISEDLGAPLDWAIAYS